MWSKITNALKPQQPKEEPPPQGGEVLSKVYEQHPNMSMFHASETGVAEQPHPSPPSSPSVHSKRNMFKRMSKGALKDVPDLPRSSSPFGLPASISKKVRNQIDPHSNASQLSLVNSTDGSRSKDMPRRSSFDMLRPTQDLSRPSQDTTRSVKEKLRRPSIDILRQENSQPPQRSPPFKDSAPDSDFLSTPGFDKFNSKRSILRDPNTPGTGQNVRFFARETYKVITPDQSLSTELTDKPQPPLPSEETPFIDRLSQTSQPASGSPPSLKRSPPSKSRPSVAEIFSLPTQQPSSPAPAPSPNNSNVDNSNMSLSFPNYIVPDENSNLFDVSQQLDLLSFPPPGLQFDVNAPMFDSSPLNDSVNDNSQMLSQEGGPNLFSNNMTSTPYRPKDPKGKGKEKAAEEPEKQDEGKPLVAVPEIIDETIFHAKEKSPKFAPPLHERSQSFSFGQTLFYSMANSGGDASKSTADEAAYPSSELKPESVLSSSASSAPPLTKGHRSRAMSDTVFQTMLRSTPTKPVEPEADINDESSSGLVVYSGGPSEPDPFSAHANTYYTPQTMIPTTPPKGAAKHNRKTSKEENLIISLQTQLALRTELCNQYETDLKARDELVEILGKKLSDVEKEDAKRKNSLRSWRKKVQELERACRQLEEAVEESRQESMERSVMDEASGEALRMLHRQIASLEREKTDWLRKEHALQEEVETLEGLVRERSEDIMNLKESLWTRDESDRELKEGIREAKEQIDMMGNISVGVFDEEELKRLLAEKDQKNSEETQRFRTVELELRQELEEVKMKHEGLEVQKVRLEEQLQEVNQQLSTRNEEHATLKSELEAQWGHTESAGSKIETLEKGLVELAQERDSLKLELDELEARTANMEVDWNESENRRNELEAELQEVWNLKDALEKDRGELEDTLHQEREHADQLAHQVQERDTRISELEQEQQFANDNIARLEQNLHQRDEELAQYTRRVVERESEVEHLREEMSKLKREHSHLLNEQTRALQDVTGQQDQTKARMDELIRVKAESDVELKTSRDRVTVLKEEVERLRRQIHSLQQESADKEVKILQMTKQHSLDKEDMQGLNIALDSKQQELELLKRKMGLRGTAGSTPAQPSKTVHRRDSSVFSPTPVAGSRPPSVISDSGTDVVPPRKERNSSETPQPVSARIAALGKSARVNVNTNASASSSKVRPSVEGAMGPPPLKSRPSLIGTPTPTGRISSLSRSSSAKGAVATTPVPHRRVSSVAGEQAQVRTKVSKARIVASPALSVAELDEKENVDDSSSSARKGSMIPTLA